MSGFSTGRGGSTFDEYPEIGNRLANSWRLDSPLDRESPGARIRMRVRIDRAQFRPRCAPVGFSSEAKEGRSA